MSDTPASLYLVTPVVADPDAIAAALRAACAGGQVAAVLLRLAASDERSLVNRVKALAPLVQPSGVALVITVEGEADPVAVAGRGGADGVHVSASLDPRPLRERLSGERILGVGEIRSKHDAMTAGEAGADYVMFGEPRPDGFLPSLESIVERAEWWAEIFATPCVAFAPEIAAIAPLVGSGAEFIALGDAVWQHPAGPAAAIEEAHRLIVRAAVA